MLVHPSFDPVDHVWFTDDGFEAPTIAALAATLAPRQIADYHPEGVAIAREASRTMGVVRYAGPKTRARKEMERAAMPVPELRPGRYAPPPTPREPSLSERILLAASVQPPKKGRPRARRIDWGKALDLWSMEGPDQMEQSKIAQKLGCSTTAVCNAIKEARKLGDPRAKKRCQLTYIATNGSGVTNIWTEEALAEMQSMVAQGYSASQIGRKLGKTRNAVIGKLHRMGGKYRRG